MSIVNVAPSKTSDIPLVSKSYGEGKRTMEFLDFFVQITNALQGEIQNYFSL